MEILEQNIIIWQYWRKNQNPQKNHKKNPQNQKQKNSHQKPKTQTKKNPISSEVLYGEITVTFRECYSKEK